MRLLYALDALMKKSKLRTSNEKDPEIDMDSNETRVDKVKFWSQTTAPTNEESLRLNQVMTL